MDLPGDNVLLCQSLQVNAYPRFHPSIHVFRLRTLALDAGGGYSIKDLSLCTRSNGVQVLTDFTMRGTGVLGLGGGK